MYHGVAPKKVGDTEYVIEPNSENKMNVPVRIFADEQLLSKMLTDRTIMQATNVATIPGTVGHVAVLPDGHEGYGFPVGGVAAMDAEEGMISPGGVGYDINCGVRLLRTNLDEKQVRPRLKELVTDLFSSIPSGVGSKGAIRLSPSELDEVLSRGVKWAVDNGYGQSGDADVCEEDGHMKNADPHTVSDRARKRGAARDNLPNFFAYKSFSHPIQRPNLQTLIVDMFAHLLPSLQISNQRYCLHADHGSSCGEFFIFYLLQEYVLFFNCHDAVHVRGLLN